ncbi:hypothetical protein K4K59_000127 [Colletotrichum sp. SAR11_240]|nr:hypothetical protein K4K59_000127 [Colletotrichum sp. SAR11_240]
MARPLVTVFGGAFLHFKQQSLENGEKMKKVNGNDLADGKTMGYGVRRGSFFTSNNKSHKFIPSLHYAAQQRIKLTDNTEILLTTILGDDGFTGMFPAFITLAGVFANSSEVIGAEVCRAVTTTTCEWIQVTGD